MMYLDASWLQGLLANFNPLNWMAQALISSIQALMGSPSTANPIGTILNFVANQARISDSSPAHAAWLALYTAAAPVGAIGLIARAIQMYSSDKDRPGSSYIVSLILRLVTFLGLASISWMAGAWLINGSLTLAAQLMSAFMNTNDLVNYAQNITGNPLDGNFSTAVIFLVSVYMLGFVIVGFIAAQFLLAFSPVALGLAMWQTNNPVSSWTAKALIAAGATPPLAAIFIVMTFNLVAHTSSLQIGGPLVQVLEVLVGAWLTTKAVAAITSRSLFEHHSPLRTIEQGMAIAALGPRVMGNISQLQGKLTGAAEAKEMANQQREAARDTNMANLTTQVAQMNTNQLYNAAWQQATTRAVGQVGQAVGQVTGAVNKMARQTAPGDAMAAFDAGNRTGDIEEGVSFGQWLGSPAGQPYRNSFLRDQNPVEVTNPLVVVPDKEIDTSKLGEFAGQTV